MLVLRLKRIGKKHQPSYRVVVGERRSKLKGDYTEDVGWYNPILNKGEFKGERVKYWLGVGAKPSVTVHNLLVRFNVVEGKKIPKHKQGKNASTDSAQEKEGEEAAAPAAAEATPEVAAEESAAPAAPAEETKAAPEEAAPAA